MNKELLKLCERLIVGDILQTDFRIKVRKVVQDMTEEELRTLARTLLLKD